MTRRGVHDAAQVAVSVLLLALVLHFVDAAALIQTLLTAQAAPVLLAIAVTVPMQVLSAWRWRFTAHRLGLPLPFTVAVSEYYTASLLNATLPSGIAGDALRVWRHAQLPKPDSTPKARYRPVLHAVVLERAAGQVALLLVLMLGLVAARDRAFELDAVGLSGLVLVALAALALAGLASGEHVIARSLRALAADARLAFAQRRAFVTQLALSLAVASCYVIAFWLSAFALGSELNFVDAFSAVPLVLLAMLLPVSVGGLGLREAAAVAIWPLFGLPAHEGAAAALLYGVVIIVGALPGAGPALMRIAAARRRDIGADAIAAVPQAIRTTSAVALDDEVAKGSASRSRSKSTSPPSR